MRKLFGARSDTPAHTRLTNGYDLFGWVMRMQNIPSFWGRILSGEHRTTPEEADFLREKGCKLALIFDELTERGVSATDGTGDALRAVEAARALAVPEGNGIALFADIKETWSVNHNWMITYANNLLSNGYVPGFIGNTDSSKNFNFNRQCSHYVQFMEDTARINTAYWATQPEVSGEPEEWAPYCPSALSQERIDLWSNLDQITFGDMTVKTVYIRDKDVLRFLW